MLSNLDMADIIMIEDRRDREKAIDALSEDEAKKMLKSLTGVVRRMHDLAREVES